ncbi:HipA family kinase [Tunicatimonas pelagia]|uniref:HipA family kinase n=1 Tax=Tunicatimonas pelagia TaxID=931531 RepID=UPI0026663E05|nr:HipA family kinase [Tunicatimonas pelagia]WKN43394.1 aminotransferase class I and II [Tunicatimonas pelagia]
MNQPEIRTVDVVRYVQPLREGGSLPAIVEADDGFLYVLKFRGAGQGKKALIAELIGGELARAIGLKVPELVFMNLDDSFSKTEPDEEIQDLLKFSVGLNLGLHYLSGAITYDPLVSVADSLTASKVVLLDSIISNVDRTYKNTNLLNWHRELWLIDHGASLYFHHSWDNWQDHTQRTFPLVKDHVLLYRATELDLASQEIKSTLSLETIQAVVATIPDDWLLEEGESTTPQKRKEVYAEVLIARLSNIDLLVKEATDARPTSV